MNTITNRELCEEIKAIRDLAEQLADKMDELNLRLNRKPLTDEAGEVRELGLADFRAMRPLPAWITGGRRDDEDDGGD